MIVNVMLKAIADKFPPLGADKQRKLFAEFQELKQLLAESNLLTPKGLPVSNAMPQLSRLHGCNKIKRLCQSKDILVLSNLRGAIRQANRYFESSNVSASLFDDLVSAGCEGLTYALYKFSPGEGTKFSTYAHFWVMAKIRQQLSNTQLIKPLSKNEPYPYRFYTELKASPDSNTNDIFDSVIAPEPDTLLDLREVLTADDIAFLECQEPLIKMLLAGQDSVESRHDSIKEKVLALI